MVIIVRVIDQDTIDKIMDLYPTARVTICDGVYKIHVDSDTDFSQLEEVIGNELYCQAC